jgi:AcrR family transcriptional regulator
MLAPMPKVSDAHLAARREQVLRAAWTCFDRNGFHATTMADVIAESGLSAGAVYRYFPGKADLIRATADRALGTIHATLSEILAAHEAIGPVDAVERILGTVEEVLLAGPTDVSRIAMMAWAESLRAADIHAITNGAMTTLREGLGQVAARARDAGHLPADADPAAVAQVIMSLLTGWIVQRNIAGVVPRNDYVAAIRCMLPARARPRSGGDSSGGAVPPRRE